jgi:hypothetical protein
MSPFGKTIQKGDISITDNQDSKLKRVAYIYVLCTML